jgi:hypothetical protein
MTPGYVLTAYAMFFFIGVFVGTNASDWLDKREQHRRAERKRPRQ